MALTAVRVAGATGAASRVLVFLGGLLFAFPGSDDLGIGHWEGVAAGAVVAAAGLLVARMARAAEGVSR